MDAGYCLRKKAPLATYFTHSSIVSVSHPRGNAFVFELFFFVVESNSSGEEGRAGSSWRQNPPTLESLDVVWSHLTSTVGERGRGELHHWAFTILGVGQMNQS